MSYMNTHDQLEANVIANRLKEQAESAVRLFANHSSYFAFAHTNIVIEAEELLKVIRYLETLKDQIRYADNEMYNIDEAMKRLTEIWRQYV